MPLRKVTLRTTTVAVSMPVSRASASLAAPDSAEAPGYRPEVKPATSEFNKASPVDRRDERSNLQLYLNEIRQTPLLTIEEEIKLAARIKKGDKASRDHMINANLRLVV